MGFEKHEIFFEKSILKLILLAFSLFFYSSL